MLPANIKIEHNGFYMAFGKFQPLQMQKHSYAFKMFLLLQG